MGRRLRVTQEALDEFRAPAAMEPPCPTVSHVHVWHSAMYGIQPPCVVVLLLEDIYSSCVCVCARDNALKESTVL